NQGSACTAGQNQSTPAGKRRNRTIFALRSPLDPKSIRPPPLYASAGFLSFHQSSLRTILETPQKGRTSKRRDGARSIRSPKWQLALLVLPQSGIRRRLGIYLCNAEQV